MTTKSMNQPAIGFPRDDALEIGALLSETSFAERICHDLSIDPGHMSCTVRYVRYRPLESCIAAYDAEFLSADTQSRGRTHFYAKALPVDRFAMASRELKKERWHGGTLLPAPVAWPDSGTLVYESPDDARLPGLTVVANLDELSLRIASQFRAQGEALPAPLLEVPQLDLIRYKPESRYIAQLSWGESDTADYRMALRVQPPRQVASQISLLMRLEQALASCELIATPRLIFAWPDTGIVAHQWIAARRVSELIRTESLQATVTQIATGLACFHDLRCAELPTMDWSRDERRLKQWLHTIVRCDEDQDGLVEVILQGVRPLGRSIPGASEVTAHGDFHQGQLLFDGKRVWFLDLAHAHRGHRERDLGNFAAQIIAREQRGHIDDAGAVTAAFLKEYGSRIDVALNRQRLQMWTAVGLVHLAAKQCRRLRPGWRDTSRGLLQRAAQELDLV